MAQAARLSIRMQKELKLLLTDPPPGASFPFLSSDSDITSLSTIDAQIEGPEGTVYSKGIFQIKIQIPERYPFQPPNVTFVTPIYHPNIDNGGRICLDILNLPPKGAWQPSLNISTVMTSIGLLLSEPNPDDGLMCEMSREYKYNRCIFDQKARVMTEKYAKAGACGHSWKNQNVQTNAGPSTSVDGKQSDQKSKHVVFPSNSKPCGISRKLSLAPSRSTHNESSEREENVNLEFTNMGEKIEREELSHISDNHNPSCEKLRGSGITGIASLESSVQFHKREDHDMEDQDPKHSYLHPYGVSLPMASKELPLCKDGNGQQFHLHQDSELAFDNKITISNKPFQVSQKTLQESLDACQMNEDSNKKMLKPGVLLSSEYHSNSTPPTFAVCSSVNQYQQKKFQHSSDELSNGAIDSKCKRTSPFCKKLSLGFRGLQDRQRKDEKENVLLISKSHHSNSKSQMKNEIIRNQFHNPLDQLQGSNKDSEQLLLHSVKLRTDETQNHNHNQDQTRILTEKVQQWGEEIPVPESVIVLDSDSEEETSGAIRSKLSIVRKRMGKRKTQA